MPFVSVKEPEYTAELNLATHSLIGDLHDVNNCLRGLKLKFELLRYPDLLLFPLSLSFQSNYGIVRRKKQLVTIARFLLVVGYS